MHTKNCTFAHGFDLMCTFAHVKYALLHTILLVNLHFCTLYTYKICTFAHVKFTACTFALGQNALLHSLKCTFTHVQQSVLKSETQEHRLNLLDVLN